MSPRPHPDEVVFFESPHELRAWFEAHHDTAAELWMGLRKKHVAPRGLAWEDAVPEALSFGWIDSVSYRLDDDARAQRWTPRRTGSIWSKVNIEHVERLISEGRMHPAGLAAYAARRDDRSGVYTYEQAEAKLAAEHAELLTAHPTAYRFWQAATPGYRKLCTRWIASAKQQSTRDRRAAQLVECCAAGELIPSQRYGEVPSWVARARAAASED